MVLMQTAAFIPERLECLQVELQGRVQKQEQDNAWYTCINYIGVSGKPLYGFVPCRQAEDRPPAGLCLRQVPSDSPLSGRAHLQVSCKLCLHGQAAAHGCHADALQHCHPHG